MPGPSGSRWARAHAGDWRYQLKRLPDEDVLNDVVEAVFLAGQCHALAYNLWALYRLPMVGAGLTIAPGWKGPHHFGSIARDGRILDIQGIHAPYEWMVAWGGADILYVPESDLFAWLTAAPQYKMTPHARRFADALMHDERSWGPSRPSRPPLLDSPPEPGTLQA